MNELIPNIEEMFITPDTIFEEVTGLVKRTRMNYLEATVHYCEQHGYDIEAISKIIPQSLRTLMEEDAKRLKLLKKNYYNNNTLPL